MVFNQHYFITIHKFVVHSVVLFSLVFPQLTRRHFLKAQFLLQTVKFSSKFLYFFSLEMNGCQKYFGGKMNGALRSENSHKIQMIKWKIILFSLPDYFSCTELDFCEFSIHMVGPSRRYLIKRFLDLTRSECLILALFRYTESFLDLH